MKTLRNEDGFSVLLLALMVLLVMTALASAMMMTTIRETKSVNKLKLSTQAFYSAESGIQIAVAELNAITPGDIDASPDYFSGSSDETWKEKLLVQLKRMQGSNYATYSDNLDGFTFSQELYSVTGMTFETKVAFQGTGTDILCYGKKGSDYVFEIGTLAEFAGKSPGIDFWPVFTITSIGKHGNNPNDLFKYVERNVQIMVKAEPTFTFPEAALTLNGDLDPNGAPNSIVGEGQCLDEDDCTCMKDITGIPADPDKEFEKYGNPAYPPPGNTGWNPTTEEPCIVGEEGCAGTTDIGSLPDFDGDGIADPYPVGESVAALISQGTLVDPSNNLDLGNEYDNTHGIYYYQGDVFNSNNITGWGILVIDGSIDLGGTITWTGLIIVTGDVIFSGNGIILGSVISGGDVRINGTPDIVSDCGGLEDLWKASVRYEMKWWKEIPGRHELEDL